MSTRPGLHDPDDWLGWWQSLHHSDLLPGELARLALRQIESPDFEEGPGVAVLRFAEGGRTVEVRVDYLMEQFPAGRIFHVLSIRSEGDPLPPVADR